MELPSGHRHEKFCETRQAGESGERDIEADTVPRHNFLQEPSSEEQFLRPGAWLSCESKLWGHFNKYQASMSC